MRVLIDAVGISPTITAGWYHAMGAAGWETAVLPDHDHVFDVFHDFKPDALLSAAEPCRPVRKCIEARPRLKVVPIRPETGFDSVLYRPGNPQPALACDLAFVAHWTPEKSPLYESFLGPVIAAGKYDVKLFGAGRACPYPQHLGWLDDSLLPDLYASAKFCLDIVHLMMTERYFQIVGLGGRCVTNGGSPAHAFIDDASDLIEVLEDPDRILNPVDDSVVRTHCSYFSLVASALRHAGLNRKCDQLLQTGGARLCDATPTASDS